MNNHSKYLAIILAAGKGTRLQSSLPKALYEVCGQSMIDYLIASLSKINFIDILTVVGHQKEKVVKHIKNRSSYIFQEEQLGTGDAVMQCRGMIEKYDNVFVLVGDAPFISTKYLLMMINLHKKQSSDCTFLYSKFPMHLPYGRLLFDKKQNLKRIVEDHQTDESNSNIRNFFTSQSLVKSKTLLTLINDISPDSITGEYNLTDTINFSIKRNYKLSPIFIKDYWTLMGINSLEDMEMVLSHYRHDKE